MLKLVWNNFLKAKVKKSENSNVIIGEDLAYCFSTDRRQQQPQFKSCRGDLFLLLARTTS